MLNKSDGFKVGEKVVYPAHGVGVIESLQIRNVSGTQKKFYMLRIVDSDSALLAGAYHEDGVDEHGFAINPGHSEIILASSTSLESFTRCPFTSIGARAAPGSSTF